MRGAKARRKALSAAELAAGGERHAAEGQTDRERKAEHDLLQGETGRALAFRGVQGDHRLADGREQHLAAGEEGAAVDPRPWRKGRMKGPFARA